MKKFMTPEQVYANLLQNIEKVKEILKSTPNEGKVEILLNKERMMTAVITEDGHVSEAFSTLEPQHFSVGDAMKLHKCYKDINDKTIRMELVTDYTYYTLLLEKLEDGAKAFQNVYGY